MIKKFLSLIIVTSIILIVSTQLSSSSSFSKGDIEWADAVSGTLYKDDMLKNGNYSVKVIQFPGPVFGIKDINGNWIPETDVDPMALLDIYKDDKLIKEVGVKLNDESFIDEEYEIKISATNFPDKKAKEWIYQFYRPWVDISIQSRGKPKLDISITTDKDEYTSYSDQIIEVHVSVTNTGEAFAKDTNVDLNVGDLKLMGGNIGEFHHNFYRLEKGNSQNFQIKLLVPDLIEEKTYDLSVNASGYDLKDIKYDAETEIKSVDIMAAHTYFTINKAIRDNMFLRDIATVRITVVNAGVYDVSDINIRDSLNENFQLVGNVSGNVSGNGTNGTFFWNISILRPGEDWSTSYTMKPLNVNLDGFSIPSAIAEFTARNKYYSIASENINVVVNGPIIKLDKIIDKVNAKTGEDVRVTIRINNIGDIATKILVKDTLTDNVTLMSGNLTNTFYIEPNIPQEFSYIIKMDTDEEVKLPSAVANYSDMEYMRLIKSTIFSNMPIINTKSNITNISVNDTLAPVIPQETVTMPKELPKNNIPNIGTGSLIIILIITFVIYKIKK